MTNVSAAVAEFSTQFRREVAKASTAPIDGLWARL